MRIALYFGSFNPIHYGHLIIARHVLNSFDVQQVWFIVSPQNPLKETQALLNEYHRYHLVQKAIEAEPAFRASNIEFGLPRPSYTVDTLQYLKEKYPQHVFSLILGSDSYQNLPRWKNHTRLTEMAELIVYERPGFPVKGAMPQQVHVTQAPWLAISSTYIRGLLREGKSIRFLVPEDVLQDIEANGYYRT